MLIFWVVTQCGSVGRFQRFGETYLPTSPHGVTTQNTNTERSIQLLRGRIKRKAGYVLKSYDSCNFGNKYKYDTNRNLWTAVNKVVLRIIFGPKRDEVTGGWRKLHNEELHGLYSSPSIVKVIKARRMRWAGHVARMGGGEGCIQHFGWEA
jgi:hypothetical protein